MTIEKYIEKKEYLIGCLNELQDHIDAKNKWIDNGAFATGDDFKHSAEYEYKFTALVKTKKKLADMINDINSELELMTLY